MYCLTYRGEKYIKNTIVKLNKNFVKEHCGQNYTTAKFSIELDTYYLFVLVDETDTSKELAHTVFVDKNKAEDVIEKIIEPHRPHVEVKTEAKQEKYNDFDYPGLLQGWIIYIFFMCLFSIFKDAIGFWILTSVVFFNWRSEKLKPYRKNK